MGSGSLAGGGRRCRVRSIVGYLVAISIAITITVGVTEGTRAEGTAAVAAAQLNLRSEPSTAAPVVALMVEGETVSLLAGPTGDGWYQVQYGDIAGWVDGSFLLIDGAPGWDAVSAPTSPPADPSSSGSSSTALTAVIDPATVTTPVALASEIVPLTFSPEPAPATQSQPDETLLAPEPTPTLEETPEPALAAEQRAKDSSNHKKDKDRDKPSPEDPSPTPTPAPAATEVATATPTVTATETPSATPESDHWVDVNRSNQLVTLYEGDTPIAAFPASLGFDSSDNGYYATAVGTYYIYQMYADLNWTDWGQAWIRDWVGFDPERQNGFHSYSMDASGTVLPDGAGPTGGCVALAPAAADQLFAFVAVGTRVVVHR